ncbi:MAG: YncE family protein [Candidatus Thermoplasmatota archaeon]|nr:YncE family protein [Candidatus Thermoplasmatota archaeon]
MSVNKYLLLVLSVIVLLALPIYAFEVPATFSGSSSRGYEKPYALSVYNVYMHPVGLPSSSIWNVTVSGTTYTSSADMISFTLQSGKYAFNAATLADGISWDYAENTFTVNDSSINVSVYFTQDQYIGNRTVQHSPFGVAFDPYNNYMYVANGASGNVSVINQSNVVIRNISVQSVPAEIAFDPYNNYMYVANGASGTVSVINQSNVVIRNISVQKSPGGIAFDPYNNYMYVTNLGNNTVSVINQSNIVIKNISVQSEPFGIAFDPHNNYIYVENFNSSSVSVINQSNVVIKNISVQHSPFGVAFDPYNNYMYVANARSRTVSVINQSNVVIKNISVQSVPAEIAFDPYNNYMYVANDGSNNVSVINQSNVVIKNISVQSEPIGIAFDPYNNYMYVANDGNHTVSILSSTHDITFYNVMFKGNDLPTGTTWNVSIAGRHFSTDSNEICISLTPAQYTYSATNSNRSFFPVTGTFNVSNNMIIHVQFPQALYQVIFTEKGLPSDTTWYLNLTNDQSFQSTTDTISLSEPNGTYYYTISSMEGRTYSSSPSSGTFPISGYNYSLSVKFTEITNQVTFTETGLPSGTTWDLNLSNGQSFHSTMNTISFMEPNGSYAFILGYPRTWSTSNFRGTINVNGSSVSIFAVFSPVSFQVLIIENGLPSGTAWKASLQSNTTMTRLTSSNYMTFDLQNGTYSYAFATTNSNYMDEHTGQFTVKGNSITVYANFTVIMYNVTLDETGLSSGAAWSVALDNSTLFSSSSSQNVFQLPNGTYYLTANSVGYLSNFTGSATHIVVTIHGSALVYHVTFTKVSAKVSVTTTSDLLIAAGAVAGTIAGIAVGYMVFRKKK